MKREKRLDIRLSQQEHKAIEILAAREGRKLSELARELIRSSIEARGMQTVGLINLLYKGEAKDDK